MEFGWFAAVIRWFGVAIQLIRVVTTIIVSIAQPHLLHTFVVVTLELVRLACSRDRRAVSLVGSIAAIGLAVAHVVVLYAFVVAASLFVGHTLTGRAESVRHFLGSI